MKEIMTVGEMSALFKINVQTLHYYDSIGLFQPAIRDAETGRRHYNFDQVYKLASILYMRTLDYSLRQIRDYMERRSMDHSLEHLRKQSEVLRERTRSLMSIDTAIQRKIHFIEREIDRAQEDQVEVRYYPQRSYFLLGEEDSLYRSEAFYFYPTIAFYEGDRKFFGANLSCEDALHLNEVEEGTLERETIEAGYFLCGYHFGPYRQVQDSALAMRKQARELKLSDRMMDFNIIDQFIEKDPQNYITCMQVRILDESFEDKLTAGMKIVHERPAASIPSDPSNPTDPTNLSSPSSKGEEKTKAKV